MMKVGSSMNNNEMVKGSIFKTLLLFSIPLFCSYFFQQLYNTIDTMIVGHTLGELSLAALGCATPLYDLLVGFAIGMGSGFSIVVARYFGANDDINLKKAVASSVIIGIILSLLMMLFTRFALEPILKLLQTPSDVFKQTYEYLSWITFFTLVMFAYNLCAGLLRAIGNSITPLLFLVIASILNIGLDYLFILVFDMGVKGAAIATVLAQGISVIACIIYMLKKAKLLIPKANHFTYDKKMYLDVLSQGLSMGFMSSIVSLGTTILQFGINHLGSLVIAAHNAARKAYSLGMIPFNAMISSISVFVSQNYGAKQIKRIKQAMKIAYLYNLVLTFIFCLIFYFGAEKLIVMISGSNEAIILNNGSHYLYVVAPFYFILGFVTTTRSALQAIGSKWLPLISSVIELIGKILFVLLLIPKFAYQAVIWCEPIIWCMMAIQLLYAFWTHKVIRGEVC